MRVEREARLEPARGVADLLKVWAPPSNLIRS